MSADSRSNTLVTICLANEGAVEQALPLILSFAAVGSPPSVFFEAAPDSSLGFSDQLEQLLEFGVRELYASDGAKLYIDQHCASAGKVTSNPDKVRALHTQTHAIYSF